MYFFFKFYQTFLLKTTGSDIFCVHLLGQLNVHNKKFFREKINPIPSPLPPLKVKWLFPVTEQFIFLLITMFWHLNFPTIYFTIYIHISSLHTTTGTIYIHISSLHTTTGTWRFKTENSTRHSFSHLFRFFSYHLKHRGG
jgi:hypothetical protein